MTERKTQVTGDWAEGKTYTAVISDRVGHGFVDPRFTATEALRVAMDQAALVAANPGLFDVVEIENMAPLSFTIWPIDAESAGDAVHVFDEDGLFNLNNGWTWVEAGEIAGSNAGSLANSLAENAGSESLAPGTVVAGLPLSEQVRESLADHAKALDEIPVPVGRGMAEARRGYCVFAGSHKIVESDNNWCRTCDTGNCTDCAEPVFWAGIDGWYHHVDRHARACFLIQEEGLPDADDISEAGWASNSPGFSGHGPDGEVTWADLDRFVAAKESFLRALDAFLKAGKALSDAWDADGFNADEWAGLPSEIAPPMSLDEWMDALSEHYARA